MTKKQMPLRAGDECLVNVGESRYFNAEAKTIWVPAVVDRVVADGNRRRYDLTIAGDGRRLYGEHPLDVRRPRGGK